ncbi:MAG: inositol monophosphatase [Chloroflexota bacterium]|nr:MAG: inositol monophosphatase [Chloroflexota bacterium]
MNELDFAVDLAIDAGAILTHYFRTGLAVEAKGWADPVTEADRAAETLIQDRIARAYPNDGIYGEEHGRAGASASARLWVVDPLDGTANFAGGMPVFAVCLTLIDATGPVMNVTYDPMRGEAFTATRGGGARLNGRVLRVDDVPDLSGALVHISFPRDRRQWRQGLEMVRLITEVAPHARNIGSSALAQTYVAAGRLHAHARVSVGDFDIVGGNLLIEEAGGITTSLDGGAYGDGTRGLLAASPIVHQRLLAMGLARTLDID